MIDLSATYYTGIDYDHVNINKYYKKHKSFKLGTFNVNVYNHYDGMQSNTIFFTKTNITKASTLKQFETILKEKHDINLKMHSDEARHPFIEVYGPHFKLLKSEVRLKILVTFDAVLNNLIK